MAKVERDEAEEMIEMLGTIRSITGAFMIADSQAITERWAAAGSSSGAWVVDIRGEQAKYLSGRDGYSRETLSDGTERVFCTDQQQAVSARESVQHVCGSKGWLGVTTIVAPIRASITRARDVSRECGAGLVDTEFAAFLSTGPVEIRTVKGKDGKVREIRLTLAP